MTAHIGDHVRDMSVDDLAVALWRGARGLHSEEAAVGLLIASGIWLDRTELREYVTVHCDPGDEPVAYVSWPDVAADAADSGCLSCSASERQILLCAAGLAGEEGRSLLDMVGGLDPVDEPYRGRLRMVLDAITHAAGWHEWNIDAYLDGGQGGGVAAVAGRCTP